MKNMLLIFLQKNTKVVKEFFEYIINILFPSVCCICGKFNKKWICINCYKKIEKLMINEIFLYDKYAELRLKNDAENKNIFYKEKINYYDKILYIFKYEGIIRKLIIDYKFNDKSYLNNFFSSIILNNKFDCDILKKYDIIISVPLSKKRMNKRGYNQTDLIARKISKSLNIEYKLDYLVKIKETIKQSSLNKKERIQNIKDAFVFNNKYNIKNKKIILIDDVFTTGNTVNECSKVLRKNGAKEILVLIIAKD